MLNPGEQIAEWVVEAPIGEGGMGSIYRCRHRHSERIRCALKVMKKNSLADAEARFVREAEALYALRHPAVVRVVGFGRDDAHGMVWLAMELAEGEDLEHRIHRGAVPVDEAVRIFRQIADGLAHAHEAGIFHRDIKPANLMLSGKQALVLDFGIALDGGRTKLTTDGVLPGTLAYMPPEVYQGELPDPQRSDIYSLGLVLYEALTGQAAFPEADGEMSSGQHMVRMMSLKVQSEAFDPGPEVPDHLRELVRRATAPEPEERLATMAAFRDGLDAPAPKPVAVPAPEPRVARETEWLPNPSLSGPELEDDPLPDRRSGRMAVVAIGLAVAGLAVVAGLALVGLGGGALWVGVLTGGPPPPAPVAVAAEPFEPIEMEPPVDAPEAPGPEEASAEEEPSIDALLSGGRSATRQEAPAKKPAAKTSSSSSTSKPAKRVEFDFEDDTIGGDMASGGYVSAEDAMVTARKAMLSGDYAKAKDMANRAVDQTGSPEAWKLLGMVHEKSGETSRALVAYQRGLAVDPSGPEAAWLKAKIDQLKLYDGL